MCHLSRFIKVGSRDVHIAGITPHPNTEWLKQIARNVSMEEWGFLRGQRHLLHDGDTKLCEAFRAFLKPAGVKPNRFPPRSPDLNAYAERFVRSVKTECTSKLIFFGEENLRYALKEYQAHYREERNHQGKGNVLLFPSAPKPVLGNDAPIECKQRLGGLLKFYRRKSD